MGRRQLYAESLEGEDQVIDRYAEIAVNVGGVHGTFDYLVPDILKEKLIPGQLVEVPFGEQQVQGVIIRVKKASDFDGEIKLISSVLDKQPVVTPPYLELAEALSVMYHQPLASYLMAMLPPGMGQRSDILFTVNVAEGGEPEGLTQLQKKVMDVLVKKGSLRGRQLNRMFPRTNWRRSMRSLVRKGWVRSHTVLPQPKVSKKQINTVCLSSAVREVPIEKLAAGRKGSAASDRRRRIIKLLQREKEPVDVSYIYASTGASSADIRFLEDQNWVQVNVREQVRDPVKNFSPEGSEKPHLTNDQRAAWKEIMSALHAKSTKPILLRGITGSGKTELYMQAAESVEKSGKQAVILVPEIALTPQTIQRFLDRFPDRVGVIHSKLSPGERYDTWRRARRGDISVLIGPRSALLTPLPNLGVIVLDECHDNSYYQGEMGPVYHSVEAAISLGKITGVPVMFGSATPNVDMFFRAQMEAWTVIHLEKRIAARTDQDKKKSTITFLPLPAVNIVDMREELQAGNSSIFSRSLQSALKNVVAKGQQAILFLNRRGSTTIIFCRDCGNTLLCPHCDFPLTYHQIKGHLTCHTCGYLRKMPEKCPECGSARIKRYGMGTERVERLLGELIPSARILRWDADTVAGKRAEAVILSHFKQHNADILVGTQMLAKGLDLPLVTLVGMILADVGINFPDYRAAERAFQLLTQVAGRAGRSTLGGKAILQTFQPEHYAIQFAAQHDYLGFYEAELSRRRDIQYPPLSNIVRLETRDLDQGRARERAGNLAEEIRKLIKNSKKKSIRMIGPAPPFFAKRGGYYRWQIILKGDRPNNLIKGLKLEEWRLDVNPPDLL